MKNRLLIIFVIGMIGFAGTAFAMPPFDSQETFDFSNTIVVGKVIYVNSTFSPTHNLYHIQVEKFFKNHQDSKIILAAGQNIASPRSGNQVFNIGDRALFFLTNSTVGYDAYSGILRVHPTSKLVEPEWNACNIFKNDIPQEHWVFGGTGPIPKVHQENNTDVEKFMIGKQVTVTYDVFNHSLNAKNVTYGIIIKNLDEPESSYVYSETNDSYLLEPCTAYETLKWTFTPSKAGHYIIELYDFTGSRTGIGFTVESNLHSVYPKVLQPPLKQFKDGIKFHNIQCNDGLVLTQRGNSERSACVTLDTKIELTIRGWADDDRLLLGCVGERVQKCYPEDKDEYRKKLQNYYYGFNEEPDSKIDVACMEIEASKSTAPFFKIPSYLPEGYSFKCSFSGTPYESYLIFDNKEVQDGWISHYPELVSNGAIFIHQTDEKNAVGEKKFATYGTATQRIQETYDEVMTNNPSLHPQLVQINGMLAFTVDSCNDCGVQTANFTDGTIIQKSTSSEAKIKFIDETGVSYLLKAGIPLNELIKVAKSLQ